MERLFSILTRKAIKKHVASMLVVVMVLSQNMIAGAEVGSFTGETKRIKSAKGCQHNCWTDEGCQELLWQIMDADPEAYDEIREEMLAYGWDDSGYGPGFATDSDADEIEDAEQEKATPSDAEEKTDGKATPSNADEKKPEKATPSDADEKATDSDADEKVNSKYRITDDGRLKLRACEHEHDDECGYYAWKTTYQYEDEEVKVKAVVVSEKEEALPDGSELVVEKVTEPEDIEYIAQKIAEETGRLYDCSQAYDIRFEFGGDEVEPEDATVKVQLKYKEAVPVNEPGEVQAGEEAGNDIRVLHLTHDNQIEDVTGDISKNMAGDLKSATFETESFSIFVLTQVLPNGTFFQYEDEEKVITASVSNAAEIPSDAKLVVDVIGEEDERYQAAKAQLEQAQDTVNVQAVQGTELLMYDFYFLDFFDEKIDVADDTEIHLNISYKEKMVLKNTEVEESNAGNTPFKLSMYQMTNGSNLNLVGEKEAVAGNAMQSFEFSTYGTSPVAFGLRSLNGYSDQTIFDYGGDYSLAYILQNFNLFLNGDLNSNNHIVGAIAVRGKAKVGHLGGVAAGGTPYVHTTNSYSEGELTLQGSVVASHVQSVFLGMENVGKVSSNLNSVPTFISKDNQYIDFDKAFQSISNEMNRYASEDKEYITISENLINSILSGWQWDGKTYHGDHYKLSTEYGNNGKGIRVDLENGFNYKIEAFEKIRRVNYEVKMENVSDVDSVIVVKPSSNITKLVMPIVGAEGKEVPTQVEYNPDGSGLVILFPSFIGELSFPATNYFGHIVAPDTSIEFRGGNYNGCLVAKSAAINGAEGHMWPYNGKKLNPTGIRFRLRKTVNGEMPTDEQIFSFELWEADSDGNRANKSSEASPLQTVVNEKGSITFSNPLSYSTAGTHYYRVEETVPNSAETAYLYDTNYYHIEVMTKEVTSGNVTDVILESVRYRKIYEEAGGIRESFGWKSIDVPQNSLDTLIDLTADSLREEQAVFNNLTKDSTAVQIKLGKKVIRNNLAASTVPTDAEKFNFTLQPMQTTTDASTAEITIDGVDFMLSGTPDIKQNSGGEIAFEAMPYSAAGDYYYKITENSSDNQPVGAQSGYIFDTNYYYIKIKVQDIRGKLTVSGVTYWKADAEKTLSAPVDLSENLTGNPVLIDLTTQAVFENKTKEGVVLPETGSAGTRKFTYTGFWLFMMGLMGMMYSGQERKRKVRN